MQIIARLFDKTAPYVVKNLKTSTRAAFWPLLATQLDNGLPLPKAIETVVEVREKTGQGNTAFTVGLRIWAKAVRDGKKLSTVIKPWVSTEEAMLIGAGEETGNLLVSLQSISKIMEAKSAIMQALSGLIYPLFLIVVLFSALRLVGFQLVPTLTSVVRNGHWEGWAQALITLGVVSKLIYWPAVISVVSAITLMLVTMDRFDGPIRIWLDQRVPYSIYRVLFGFAFLQSVAGLVNAKINPLEAIKRLSNTTNPWLKRRLVSTMRIMGEGKDMGVALSLTGYGFPDIEAITLLTAYAEFKGFDAALQLIAEQWLTTSVKKIKTITGIMLVVGLLAVGGVILVIIEGQFALQDQFSDQMEQSMHPHRN